jgi:hypothetical protein
MEVSPHIRNAPRRYHQFRPPNRRALVVSEVSALFPDEPSAHQAPVRWPQPWPNADNAGVYLIFGPQMELLYVGKADNLSSRVSAYF